VLTLRGAAALLTASGPEALAGIAAACGCDAPPLPIAPPDRAALGLAITDNACTASVRVARGPGCTRALLVDLGQNDAAPPLPDLVSTVAARLVRRTPQLAWLCIATGRCDAARPDRPAPRSGGGARRPTRGARQLVLATWSSERCPPRIAALVVDPSAVMDSDAETLAALAATAGLDGTAMHSRWLDLLGRESLNRRFYRALDRAVGELATSLTVPSAGRRPPMEVRRELALLCASRLLFLAFLEAKGWLDRDRAFLARIFADCVSAGGGVSARVLRPLFFGTLNTPVAKRSPTAARFGTIPFLNGGLFAPTPVERRVRGGTFSDAALGILIGDVLGHYRFTAREDLSTWSEAAVDPEMLGRSFEALMAPSLRHATGAYYTPHALVSRVADAALTHALASASAPASVVMAALRGESIESADRQTVRDRLSTLRIVDPACGSGAFLVHLLQQLAGLAGHLGDERPASERRRVVLTRSIFGVDVNPTAVWLCELRLWLAVVIENPETEPTAIVPLPNLDRNVRVGDALAGGAFDLHRRTGPGRTATERSGIVLHRLRERYARATGASKRATLRALDRLERTRAVEALRRELARVMRERLDAVTLARGRDLFGGALISHGSDHARRADLRHRSRVLRSQIAALREGAAVPFTFATHFGEVDEAGGFDLVVGNPPWVRPHAVPVIDRERWRRDFLVSRHAAWMRGAEVGRAGPGFGTQVDLAALFVERALTIARPGGIVAMLLPAKLWRCLAGGGVRRLVMDETTLLRLEDWSGLRRVFDAAAYPSLMIVRRKDVPAADTPVTPITTSPPADSES
jgi:hypothetical protein